MNSSDGMLIVNVSAIQAVAIAAVTYYFGAWLRKKVPFLEKYSVPSPVVGGMLVALVLSCLEYFHFMKVNFDTSLQTLLMLAFFTTIGLSASLKIVTEGGKLLVSFLFVITILCVLQNFLGMGLAEMMGLDFHYGLLAGSVSMMGGLGTSAAFGPYFEQTYGVQGGTAVAITAATFGTGVALLIGAPFAEWLIRKYKVITPKEVDTPEPELHIPEDLETTVVEGEKDPTYTPQLLKAGTIVAICMGLGAVLSQYMGQYITLPAYIGSMIVAAIVRNVGDFSGKYTVEGKGMNAIAEISLVLFVTMAINGLKLHELLNLALPLMIILAGQTILMVVFAWAMFFIFGKTYDAVMLCAGGIGFSMGSTANGLANMQAIAEKYGSSPRAWLIISLVGAFLIDLINALLVTWMGAW